MILCMTSANEFRETPQNLILERCIAGVANGDREALAELYNATSPAVYSFALSVLKNTHDAEDVLQNCYLNIASSAGSYRSKGKPMAWILTITRNLCLMKIRDYQKTATMPNENWMQYLESNEKVTPEDRIVLSDCMKRLSDQERQIVVLHVVAGLKHREIAQALAIPLSTVLSKHRRALKKLKLLLGGEH